jgi:hypothetical protein
MCLGIVPLLTPQLHVIFPVPAVNLVTLLDPTVEVVDVNPAPILRE